MLVNNAGMSPAYDDLASVSEDLYDKVHAINARGPFRLSALIGERMAGGRRRIDHQHVVGGSLAARPSIDLPYAMAKAALNALTLGLAGEWAPKVRANLVLPSATETDMNSDVAGRDQGPDRGVEPDEAAGASRGRGRQPACSWPATQPAMSTAPRCRSTAGSTARCERGAAKPRYGRDQGVR